MKKVTLTVLLATIYEKSHCILQISLIYKVNDSYGEVIISFNSSLWARIYKILILKAISMHVIWPRCLGYFFLYHSVTATIQGESWLLCDYLAKVSTTREVACEEFLSLVVSSHRRGTTFFLSPSILYFIWTLFF